MREQGAPIVIKADGLAAGKGVVVAETLEDAEGSRSRVLRWRVRFRRRDGGHRGVHDRPRVLASVLRDEREVLPHGACAGS